ncbi:hypothetical protein [Polaromonas sp. JS666]|uniref:hypothetical protein n=1 Tax=Polaromonas sp. (strain JS666 / ATCC BAA-500) TaxID=296591 RepID=UPI00004643B1|nr:hypothetical protein [Polaromonas sp. JS666]ABE46876.1 hypothetical protein Bpro_5004 [Polaromonas sp. JS666]
MKTSTAPLQKPIADVFPFALHETSDVLGKPMAGFVHQGVVIHDPTVTECGRFAATPDLYGMTDAQVLALERLNSTLDEATEAAINAGANVIQKDLGITTGDTAGTYFTGESQENIARVFLRYALTEIALLQAA